MVREGGGAIKARRLLRCHERAMGTGARRANSPAMHCLLTGQKPSRLCERDSTGRRRTGRARNPLNVQCGEQKPRDLASFCLLQTFDGAKRFARKTKPLDSARPTSQRKKPSGRPGWRLIRDQSPKAGAGRRCRALRVLQTKAALTPISEAISRMVSPLSSNSARRS